MFPVGRDAPLTGLLIPSQIYNHKADQVPQPVSGGRTAMVYCLPANRALHPLVVGQHGRSISACQATGAGRIAKKCSRAPRTRDDSPCPCEQSGEEPKPIFRNVPGTAWAFPIGHDRGTHVSIFIWRDKVVRNRTPSCSIPNTPGSTDRTAGTVATRVGSVERPEILRRMLTGAARVGVGWTVAHREMRRFPVPLGRKNGRIHLSVYPGPGSRPWTQPL